jgi:tRNA-specific 2-thiouridylase
MPLTAGRLVDTGGHDVGTVGAVELVTVGQRRGLGLGGGGEARYALSVDVAAGTVVVGDARDLLVDRFELGEVRWTDGPVVGDVLVQCSAHGEPRPAVVEASGTGLLVRLAAPARRVAPGQSVALYAADRVLGGGTVT